MRLDAARWGSGGVRLMAGLLIRRFKGLSGDIVELDGVGATCFFLNLGRGEESSDSAIETSKCQLIDHFGLFEQQLTTAAASAPASALETVSARVSVSVSVSASRSASVSGRSNFIIHKIISA